MRKFKRVVVLSDLHCGHRVGLTPPKWQERCTNPKYNRIQKELWEFFHKQIKALKPIDVLLINGDVIDGKGQRSGSTELITADRVEQAEIAAECILPIKADSIIITYGTPYHTGLSEDWEDVVAQRIRARSIRSQEWINVNGLIFDLKHFISRSTIPHGKGTPIAKDKLWNLIWAEYEEQPNADIIIRSHVHGLDYIGNSNKWLGMTTPALQGQGSKYGARIPSQHIDFGFVHFDVTSKTQWNWRAHLLVAKAQKRNALVV